MILRKSFNEKLVGSDYESDVGTLFGYYLNLFGFLMWGGEERLTLSGHLLMLYVFMKSWFCVANVIALLYLGHFFIKKKNQIFIYFKGEGGQNTPFDIFDDFTF